MSKADRINNDKARLRAELEAEAATSAHVIRKEDREAKKIVFARGLPLTKNGRYMCGNFKGTGTKFRQVLWDEDPHRLMVCDMQGYVDAAADERFSVDNGAAQKEDKDLFWKLVKEEKEEAERKAMEEEAEGQSTATEANVKKKGIRLIKSTRAPYKARVALRLILLLASVLG